MKKITLLLLICFAAFSCQKEITPEQSIKIENSTEYNLQQQSVMLNISVSGATDWTYDLGSGSNWMSEVSKTATQLQIQVAANDSNEERSAVITFKAGSSSATVSVKQKGKPFEPSLSLDPEGPVTACSAGETISVNIVTNLEKWEATTEAGWLTLTQNGKVLSLKVEENPMEDPREAIINLEASTGEMRALASFTLKQEEKVVDYAPEALSTDGTSNCYLITHQGQYSFDATVRGNGKASEGLGTPSKLAPADAKLVWQTSKDMIKSVSFKDGVITIEVKRVFGNALIAALDSKGNIIWSWHIWFPHEEVSTLRNIYNEEVMSYNLGAIDSTPASVTSYGLLYQWGRKDPFPGSPRASGGDVSLKNVDVYDINGNVVTINHTNALDASITGSGMSHLNYAIANPTMAIGNKNQYYSGNRSWLPSQEINEALWGNPKGSVREGGEYHNIGSKSIYDPCPKGWKLPSARTFSSFTKTGGMAWAAGTTDNLTWADLGGATSTQVVDVNGDGKISLDGDYRCGWNFYIEQASKGHFYFPSTTRYDGQYAMLMGSMVGIWGNYWYNTTDGDTDGMAQALSFGLKDYNSSNYSITLSPLSAGSQADAYAVRCIKE